MYFAMQRICFLHACFLPQTVRIERPTNKERNILKPFMKKKVYGALTILIMVVIFLFSAQASPESYKVSKKVADMVAENGWGIWIPVITKSGLLGNVRKCAHIFLYFCLGFTSSRFLFEFLESAEHFQVLKTAICSGIFCFLYSCSDEWHQTFVPGRSGRLFDVGIDAIGFLAGIALSAMLYLLMKKMEIMNTKVAAN